MTSRKQLVRCHLMHKAEKEVSQGKQSEGCTMTEGAVEQALGQERTKQIEREGPLFGQYTVDNYITRGQCCEEGHRRHIHHRT